LFGRGSRELCVTLLHALSTLAVEVLTAESKSHREKVVDEVFKLREDFRSYSFKNPSK